LGDAERKSRPRPSLRASMSVRKPRRARLDSSRSRVPHGVDRCRTGDAVVHGGLFRAQSPMPRRTMRCANDTCSIPPRNLDRDATALIAMLAVAALFRVDISVTINGGCGGVVGFFQGASRFKARHTTIDFKPHANRVTSYFRPGSFAVTGLNSGDWPRLSSCRKGPWD
jgi:hypothetical protein